MKKTISVSIVSLLAVVLVVTMAGCSNPVKNKAQLQAANESMQKAVQSRLTELNSAVSDATGKIASNGLEGEETRRILNGLCQRFPYLLDCSTADIQGKMFTVMPDAYRRYEGADTTITEASNKFLAELKANKKPVLSNVFRSVEGVDAIVLVWPVISAKGELIGDICALFKPELFMEDIIGPQARAGGLKVNIMELDGMVNYCSNGTETGKNVLTDPLYKGYPELIAQAK
jgi:hypothetical protein